jgi:hypothetical protein
MLYRTIRDMSQIPSKLGAFQEVHFGVFNECVDPPEMVKFVQEFTRSRPNAEQELPRIEAGSLVQKQFALPAYPDSEESLTNYNVEFASHRDEQFDDSPSHRRDKDQEYGIDESPSPSKKMKKETICKFCGNSYGKNFNRHMKTHLPDDSPEKIEWKAKINPQQAAWHKDNYQNNPEFKESEKLRSAKNNENAYLNSQGLPPVEDGWTPDLSKRPRKKRVVLTPRSECQDCSDDDEFPADHGRSCTELL